MSHPLDTPDTDWGRQVEASRQETNGRLGGIDERLEAIDRHIGDIVGEQERAAVAIARLDERMKASESDRGLMRGELNANTILTKSIKADTDALKSDTKLIVALERAAHTFRRFLLWAVPLASSAIAAYVAWTVKK